MYSFNLYHTAFTMRTNVFIHILGGIKKRCSCMLLKDISNDFSCLHMILGSDYGDYIGKNIVSESVKV